MSDIATLTINPAIDIFVSVDDVEPIKKMRCSAPKRDPGGGGINVARVVHRLGGDVTAIYPIGGAIGKLLQRLVEREGIRSVVVPSHVETRENFTAFDDSSGNQFRFVLPGSALHRAEWEACLDKLAMLPDKPRFVVASGSIPPGVPTDFFALAARQAKKLGAKVVIDTSHSSLAPALEEGVALIKPNQAELRAFVGRDLVSENEYLAACRKLIADGHTEAVALTLGEDGALLVTAEHAWRAEAMKIEVTSTVGAGDSFLGGFVTALADGAGMEDAFCMAVAAGSAAVMSPGTELCREEDVRRLLPKVNVSEIAAALP